MLKSQAGKNKKEGEKFSQGFNCPLVLLPNMQLNFKLRCFQS